MIKDPQDPKGLIADAFAIDGLSAEQARSIFLDWALSVEDARAALPVMIARHADADHAMSAVLREGLGEAQPKRRGGRAGRRN